jgi:hypothetical protein
MWIRLYENAMPFYIRDLASSDFGVHRSKRAVPKINPAGILVGGLYLETMGMEELTRGELVRE